MAHRFLSLFIVVLLSHAAAAQTRWNADFSFIGRKEVLISENGGKGFDNNYKFTSPLTLRAEVSCYYRLTNNISVETGIGVGSTGNGVKFMLNSDGVSITEKVDIDFMYVRFPLLLRYDVTSRWYVKAGLSLHLFTDYQRSYSGNYSSGGPFEYAYHIDAPFVADFNNTSFDLTVGYRLYRRLGIMATGGFLFSNKCPVTTMEVTAGTPGNLRTYNYAGRPNTCYLGLGLTLHLFSLGHLSKTQSVYSCPEG